MTAHDLRLVEKIAGNVWGAVRTSVSLSVKWESQNIPNPAVGFLAPLAISPADQHGHE